jgi:hypothetical protein
MVVGNSDNVHDPTYHCDMRRRRARSLSQALCCLSSIMLVATHLAAAAPGVALPVASVQSLFFIAKSENRNQVHYAAVVDAACKPVGARPIYGYWRDLEVGPRAVSPLLDHEQPAYGLSEPRYIRPNANGGQIRVSLRGFPERPLIVDIFHQGAGCAARTQVMIHGQPALLTSIYIDLGFLFSVNYAILRGVRMSDGAVVSEKIHD